MDPGPLTYMLINSVKELHAELELLKNKLKNVTTELDELKEKKS